jgi:hypothetical protein
VSPSADDCLASTAVAYWADGFDWRAAEARLNAHPQYTAEVTGRQVHFVHLRGDGAQGAPGVRQRPLARRTRTRHTRKPAIGTRKT